MSKQIKPFIKHVQRMIITHAELSQKFNVNNVYRRTLPQIKDPKYPCITMYYDLDPRQAFAEIDHVQLYITIHTDEFFDAENSADLIADLFHLYTYSDNEIVIYKMFSQGGMVSPVYDDKLRKWTSVLQFEVHLG
jgi:hypothetical protein